MKWCLINQLLELNCFSSKIKGQAIFLEIKKSDKKLNATVDRNCVKNNVKHTSMVTTAIVRKKKV
jgi:hypothetical protein